MNPLTSHRQTYNLICSLLAAIISTMQWRSSAACYFPRMVHDFPILRRCCHKIYFRKLFTFDCIVDQLGIFWWEVHSGYYDGLIKGTGRHREAYQLSNGLAFSSTLKKFGLMVIHIIDFYQICTRCYCNLSPLAETIAKAIVLINNHCFFCCSWIEVLCSREHCNHIQ